MIRVLCVPRSRSEGERIRESVRADHPAVEMVVALGEEARRLVEGSTHDRPGFDVLLIDIEPGKGEALEILRIMQEDPLKAVPVVILSDRESEGTAAEALRLGAADCVVKNDGYARRLPAVLESVAARARGPRDVGIANASSRYFRDLIDNVSDLVLALDVSGNVHFAGPSCESVLGIASSRMEGMNLFAFIHPDDTDRLHIALVAAGGEGEVSQELELRARRTDGTWRTLEVKGKSVRDPWGQTTIVATFRDVTDRRKVEQDFSTVSGTLRAIIDAAPLAIFSLDKDGRVTSWNRAAERAFGWSETEVVGRELPFIPVDKDEEGREFTKAAVSGRHIANAQVRRMRRDGSPVHLSLSIAPLYDAAGSLSGSVWLAADTTARRLYEETIHEQARLLNSALDAILVRGTDERLLYCNPAAVKLYGYSRDELHALDMRKLVVDDDLSRYEEARREVMVKGEWEGELRQRSKAGGSIVIHSRWSLVRDDAGLPRALLAINRDISRQAELESQLRRTQRMESLGTLASGIAHDLNNILSPILIAVDMLRIRFPDPQDSQVLRIVETSVHRGSDIVRQMLAFARGSEGELAPLQLRHVTREIETIIRETFPKNIRLEVEVPKNLPSILGDATQVHQVLINLCVNSRDAMPDGGTIRISALAVTIDDEEEARQAGVKPGKHVDLRVADNGEGIPPAIRERVFEPFFTTKVKGKGTGLGLSTVHSIVQGHGGSVTCESEVGKGTTFRVLLPAVVTELPARPEEPVSAIPLGAGETVLVVDDDVSILQITRQILESYDYRVLSAIGGAVAISLMKEQPRGSVRLVLTDMAMPEMAGPAVVVALRAIDPGIPVILMSGLPPDIHSPEIAALGVQAVIAKPFKAEELLILASEIMNVEGHAR